MRHWRAAAALALLGLSVAAAAVAARAVEERVRHEVRLAASAAGVSVGSVRFSWLAPLRLDNMALPTRGAGRLDVDSVAVSWRARGGSEPRAHLAGLAIEGLRLRNGALTAVMPAADFEVLGWERRDGSEQVRLRQRPGGGTVEARWTRSSDVRRVEIVMDRLDLSAGEVHWRGNRLLRAGRWSGRVAMDAEAADILTTGGVSLEAARLSLGGPLGTEDAALGPPTDLDLAWSARRAGGSWEIARAGIRGALFRLSARGRVGAPGEGRRIEAELAADGELGGTLRAAGLRVPDPLDAGPEARLGTASFEVSVRGDLADLAGLRIEPRLRFESAPEAVEALQFLRRPFRYSPQGNGTRVRLSNGAGGFVPLSDVPQPFVRMLLLSEDAGFFGHPGVDVAEIPVAWAENVERGHFARGASTITQQLARNLFLSRDKSYGRKLEEAALALALDAAVPKARILEIYLNVIEWGPGVYGLLPAARHYFGKHPQELTVKEMAFLVCLVPSPVRYHSAHRAGRAGPGMEQLMGNLLARMQSAGALGLEEYERARVEVLAFAPEGEDAPAQTSG